MNPKLLCISDCLFANTEHFDRKAHSGFKSTLPKCHEKRILKGERGIFLGFISSDEDL